MSSEPLTSSMKPDSSYELLTPHPNNFIVYKRILVTTPDGLLCIMWSDL